MAQIKTEKEFRAALARIDEHVPLTGEGVPEDDPKNLELNLLCELVGEYEDEHVVLETPSLEEVLKLRLYEMSLSQKSAAVMLGISPSRMSDLMHGRMEPSYRVSRALCQKFNIAPSVVLGV